jgi:hypothetical protein
MNASSTLARAAGLSALSVVVVVGVSIVAMRPAAEPFGSAPAGAAQGGSSSASATPVASPGRTASPNGFFGTIVYGVHDPGSGFGRVYVLPADGTARARLLVDDACCPLLNPEMPRDSRPGGRYGQGELVLFGTTLPDDRKTAAFVRLADVGLLSTIRFDLPAGVSGTPRAIDADWDLAFEDASDRNFSPDPNGVYLFPAKGGEPLWIVVDHGDPAYVVQRYVPVAFSPDGERLLFIRSGLRTGTDTMRPKIATAYTDLYVVRKDGSGVQKLNPDGTRVTLAEYSLPSAYWSPDSRRVLFTTWESTDSTVHIVDSTSSAELWSATVGGGGIKAGVAVWSPDASRIAIDIHDGHPTSGSLDYVGPDGALTFLAGGFEHEFGTPVWSPEGTALLAASYIRRDRAGLSIVPVAGGAPLWVGAENYQVSEYTWAAASLP